MLKKDGWEYWDCEGRPTRVHSDTGLCERYSKGQWSKDKSQTPPGSRGRSSSSDFTPVGDEADLAKVIAFADRVDKGVADEPGG